MIDLSFEEFLELYGEELDIEFAESGADREFEFDLDREQEERYFEYLEKKGPTSGPTNKKRDLPFS